MVSRSLYDFGREKWDEVKVIAKLLRLVHITQRVRTPNAFVRIGVVSTTETCLGYLGFRQ